MVAQNRQATAQDATHVLPVVAPAPVLHAPVAELARRPHLVVVRDLLVPLRTRTPCRRMTVRTDGRRWMSRY